MFASLRRTELPDVGLNMTISFTFPLTALPKRFSFTMRGEACPSGGGRSARAGITAVSPNTLRLHMPAYHAAFALPNARGVTAMGWEPVVIGRFVALNRTLARKRREFSGTFPGAPAARQ